MTTPLTENYSIEDLKAQAQLLRKELSAIGEKITHSKSLEMIARQYGYKDWNTLYAAIKRQSLSCPVKIGSKARGTYLGQAFAGEVIGIKTLKHAARFQITLQFDSPVDVVTFDSFSNLRHRVRCIIDKAGKTAEKTSNGRPHMQLEL